MHIFSTLAQLVLVALPALAIPTPAAQSGNYIVNLKDGVDVAGHISSRSLSSVTHEYEIINGFSGTFTDDELKSLKAHDDVKSIEEDGIVSIYSARFDDPTITQDNATWGLATSSTFKKMDDQNPADTNFNYTYFPNKGAGVTVYVVDTGVYTSHPDFNGRASWGKTVGGYSDADGNGHGTHLAGIVGSTTYGISKSVSIVGVKVLDDAGNGSVSDVITGLQWVGQVAAANVSVVLLGYGGAASDSLDAAVNALISKGIYVVAAAGNSATDANSTSPARVPGVFTVGAIDINFTVASFSNYGPILDLWAPGVDIISTWNDGTTRSVSGTSQAAAFAAGAVAMRIFDVLDDINYNALPWVQDDAMVAHQTNEISGLPSGSTYAILNNGVIY